MKNSKHPGFARVALFIVAGSFTGAALFITLLFALNQIQAGKRLDSLLPLDTAKETTRQHAEKIQDLSELLKTYDAHVAHYQRLVEQQQASIARIEQSQREQAQEDEVVDGPVENPSANAEALTLTDPPSALPAVSTAPPTEILETSEPGDLVEGNEPANGIPLEDALPVPPPRHFEQPKGLFAITVRKAGASLRATPNGEEGAPLRELQEGERFTVTRVLELTDGTWYELRRGWIQASSRTERIETPENVQVDEALLPGQFAIRIHHGVNLYSTPSRDNIWNLSLLTDGERCVVIGEHAQDDVDWYELRYGWVQATDLIKRLASQ